jgi:hypothetical protein
VVDRPDANEMSRMKEEASLGNFLRSLWNGTDWENVEQVERSGRITKAAGFSDVESVFQHERIREVTSNKEENWFDY